MIRFNCSRVLQVVEQGGRSKHLPPGWAIHAAPEEGRIAVDPEAVRTIDSPSVLFKENPRMTVGLARRGGTGDIVMLLPVIRVLLETFPELTVKLFTVPKHVEMLGPSQTKNFKVHHENLMLREPLEFGMSLEGVVERDHAGRGDRYKTMPRHLIYAEALGVYHEMRMRENAQDFSIVTTDADKRYAEKMVAGIDRPLIALQVRGNEATRALPFDRIIAITKFLTHKGYAVFPSDNKFFPKLRGDHVYQFPQATFRQVIEILKRCKILISMESAFLHFGHVANMPVICFYGPTRINERGAFHPSYKKGWVIPIQLNEEVGCRPCFFDFSQCRGQIGCMRSVTARRIVELVDQSIEKMLSILDHTPRSE